MCVLVNKILYYTGTSAFSLEVHTLAFSRTVANINHDFFLFTLQCAYGDPGLTYTFSGTTVNAQPWPKFLLEVRDKVSDLCGCKFNFVLINRSVLCEKNIIYNYI